TSLLGILTPVVMGVLGKQQATTGLDASGLSGLLASQKDNIRAALPSGVAESLQTAGVPGFSGATAAAARDTTWAGRADAAEVARAARPGLPAWATWVIPLIAIVAIAWWLLGHGPETVEQAKNTPPPAATPTQTAQPAQTAPPTQTAATTP